MRARRKTEPPTHTWDLQGAPLVLCRCGRPVPVMRSVDLSEETVKLTTTVAVECETCHPAVGTPTIVDLDAGDAA